LLNSFLGSSAFRRRVMVLGAGDRAQRLRELGEKPETGFAIVAFIAMSDANRIVEEAIPRSAIHDLGRFVENLGVSEVVLALQERRNSLPLKDLLRIKTKGVHVNDFSSFIERETGRVDLDTINPSWLIFSDGFSSSRMFSSACKRIFDITASALFALAQRQAARGDWRRTALLCDHAIRLGAGHDPVLLDLRLRAARAVGEVGEEKRFAALLAEVRPHALSSP
jgi:hypothetical protein